MDGVVVSDRWPEATSRLPARAITRSFVRGARRDRRRSTRSHRAARRRRRPWARGLHLAHARLPRSLSSSTSWAHSTSRGTTLLAAARARAERRAGAEHARAGLVEPIRSSRARPPPRRRVVGVASYWFDEPATTDAPDAVQRSEYRATYRGWAAMQLTIEATSAAPRRAQLRVALRRTRRNHTG